MLFRSECGLTRRSLINSSEMNKNNFLPPATAIVSVILDKKVDKESGKGLSANDYTTAEKTKLAGIAEGANKYVHPAYTNIAGPLGLYKVVLTDEGHIAHKAAVTKADITPLLDMDAILAALPDAMEVDY